MLLLPTGQVINPNSTQVIQALMASLKQSNIIKEEALTSLETSSDHPSTAFKLEYELPSGSFKDRALKVIVDDLKKKKVVKTAIVTSGNAGLALINALKDSNIVIRILTEDTDLFKSYMGKDRIEIVPFNTNKSLIIQLSEITLAWIRNWDFAWKMQNATLYNELLREGYYLSQPSIFVNATGLLGYAQISYEVFNQLNGSVPDWVVTPVINSDNALGQWLGYYHLYQAGKIKRIPTFVLVEQKKRVPHFNYPNAWYHVQTISPVLQIGVDNSTAQIHENGSIFQSGSSLSKSALAAEIELRKNGTIPYHESSLVIISGKNRHVSNI